jgi:hypothetical protein
LKQGASPAAWRKSASIFGGELWVEASPRPRGHHDSWLPPLGGSQDPLRQPPRRVLRIGANPSRRVSFRLMKNRNAAAAIGLMLALAGMASTGCSGASQKREPRNSIFGFDVSASFGKHKKRALADLMLAAESHDPRRDTLVVYRFDTKPMFVTGPRLSADLGAFMNRVSEDLMLPSKTQGTDVGAMLDRAVSDAESRKAKSDVVLWTDGSADGPGALKTLMKAGKRAGKSPFVLRVVILGSQLGARDSLRQALASLGDRLVFGESYPEVRVIR